jgi:hypothetical protein
MPKFQLDRRTVLKGAGGIAIALPWLEIMGQGRRASAAPAPARRFLAVYQPGGTVLEKWTPTGTETNFVLSPILAPFAPVRDKILIPGDLDMKSAIGEQRQAGLIAWLTGTAQNTTTKWAMGPSIDQLIASTGTNTARASLSMAVRWGTGKSHGLISPINIANYANNATFTPIAPALDPRAIWEDLFGAVAPQNSWDKSILDFVDRRYVALAKRLGARDKQRLDQHLTVLRELETRISQPTRCAPPPIVDTSDDGHDGDGVRL